MNQEPLETLDPLAELDAAQRQQVERGQTVIAVDTPAGSTIPRVRVYATIDVSPARVWALIDRCADYPRTMKGVKAATELSRADGVVHVRATIGMPFPLKDLTAVTKGIHTVDEAGGRYRRAWTLVEGDYEQNDGSWVLVPFVTGGGAAQAPYARTLVRYELHVKPRIRVPKKLLEVAQKKTLPSLIEHLRTQFRSNLR